MSACYAEERVRPICGQVVKWQTRDAQNVVPFVAWEFDSPLGHLNRLKTLEAAKKLELESA